MKIIIFLLLSCFLFAKKPIIIKLEESQKFEMIDLKQLNLKDINYDEALFDTSLERQRQQKYIEYEDTNKDFIILAAYDLSLENKKELINQSLEALITNINNEARLELLSQQNNYLYQHEKNLKNIEKQKEYKFFDISSLLRYEPSLERSFTKIPEYLIFLAFDELFIKEEKILFFKQEKLNLKFRFKILDTKKKILLKDKILKLELSFKPSKQEAVAEEIARSLNLFLKDETKSL